MRGVTVGGGELTIFKEHFVLSKGQGKVEERQQKQEPQEILRLQH